MKIFIALFATLAYALAQGFGGLGGFGGGGGLPIPNLAQGIGKQLTQTPLDQFKGFTEGVKSFADFVAQTGKSYATQAEKALREGIFKAKIEAIDKHNEAFSAGKSTFKLGMNPFGDLKLDEFLNGMTGRKKSEKGEVISTTHRNQAGPPASVGVPDSFDWREKGGVTPVKFQGLECGACWSFAVTGAIEGHIFRKTGKLIPLSEQNLIDCAGDPYGNTGCDGGFQDYGFDYVLENMGIAKAESYNYTELTGDKCLYEEAIKGAVITGYSVIDSGNEEKMKEVIATKGPLACSVNAASDNFQLYKSGIYKEDDCNDEEVNHSILVVGYGSENGEDYWIIKNSWTPKWGENGYMRLPRNANNYCGVATECSYPIV